MVISVQIKSQIVSLYSYTKLLQIYNHFIYLYLCTYLFMYLLIKALVQYWCNYLTQYIQISSFRAVPFCMIKTD